MNFLLRLLLKLRNTVKSIFRDSSKRKKKDLFLRNGKVPWSEGYVEYKIETITNNIDNEALLKQFREHTLPDNYGHRIDERVVEYPWIFSQLPEGNLNILDAGSTFNFDFVLNNSRIKDKDLTIYTFAPESESYNHKKVSYVYGDLRNLPFKDNLYDLVISHSTIEHIDMDNSLYGYDLSHNKNVKDKSYEYIIAVKEMIRVLKKGGNLLLTFPYGKFENHGFFQQFDEEMWARIIDLFNNKGIIESCFFKYESQGWRFANQKELLDSESYNPHTGKGKKKDNAAHSRGIACLSFIKSV